jgi:carbonic anhydrase
VPAIPFHPRTGLYVITCIDPRVDPAAFLGLTLGDAIVQRDVGGRVTPAVIRDVAYISHLVETKTPDGPWFEVAVIHHTDCGSTLLADDDLRHDFAIRIGADERTLADTPVLDPARTVRTDVNRLLWSAEIAARVVFSGHVYDLETGLVTTVVEPRQRPV